MWMDRAYRRKTLARVFVDDDRGVADRSALTNSARFVSRNNAGGVRSRLAASLLHLSAKVLPEWRVISDVPFLEEIQRVEHGDASEFSGLDRLSLSVHVKCD